MAIYSGFSHWTWWFSIAMLNYQRVYIYILLLGNYNFMGMWLEYHGNILGDMLETVASPSEPCMISRSDADLFRAYHGSPHLTSGYIQLQLIHLHHVVLPYGLSSRRSLHWKTAWPLAEKILQLDVLPLFFLQSHQDSHHLRWSQFSMGNWYPLDWLFM